MRAPRVVAHVLYCIAAPAHRIASHASSHRAPAAAGMHAGIVSYRASQMSDCRAAAAPLMTACGGIPYMRIAAAAAPRPALLLIAARRA